MVFRAILLLPGAYLLGSVPWGVVLARLFGNVDIRKAGSGNIGAYNVYRVAGIKLGIMTLVGDILKGAVPVLAATHWLEFSGWKGDLWVCLVALCAFFGHLFSVFLGFKGGKGVATGAGCFLVISPLVLLVCVLVYVMVLCTWGYSSAGSLSGAAVLPGAIWLATHSIPITSCAFTMALLIFVRHRGNIKRLLDGTEHSPMRS
ncbi:MAG: glycerol-3-phosphate 1-O-acyltransferase PlsY [Desulfobacterales bacterium]|nr:glycerol-3-phosphate 1-O-acyltransferase PlsY [Desulfobacterales bacterium]